MIVRLRVQLLLKFCRSEPIKRMSIVQQPLPCERPRRTIIFFAKQIIPLRRSARFEEATVCRL